MQCKKCEIEVPSQFEYVLVKNVCPKCGSKLMPDQVMKVYIDLKKRLNEVEFVMDKATVCERVAMFVVTNYEVISLSSAKSQVEQPVVEAAPLEPTNPPPQTAAEKRAADAEAVAKFQAELAAIANDEDMTADEIRAEEAARAEELAMAREMDIDLDDADMDLDDGEELVTGAVDANRLQRLKKLAATAKMSKTGRVGLIKRS